MTSIDEDLDNFAVLSEIFNFCRGLNRQQWEKISAIEASTPALKLYVQCVKKLILNSELSLQDFSTELQSTHSEIVHDCMQSFGLAQAQIVEYMRTLSLIESTATNHSTSSAGTSGMAGEASTSTGSTSALRTQIQPIAVVEPQPTSRGVRRSWDSSGEVQLHQARRQQSITSRPLLHIYASLDDGFSVSTSKEQRYPYLEEWYVDLKISQSNASGRPRTVKHIKLLASPNHPVRTTYLNPLIAECEAEMERLSREDRATIRHSRLITVNSSSRT